MKILMINDLYERMGGLEIYLFNLLDALEERGHTGIIIYGFETRPDNRTKNRSTYCVDFNQPIKAIVNAIAAIIKKESPDIIHIHNLGRLKKIYNYIGQICGSLPLVQSVHGHGLYCPSGIKYFYNCMRICQRKYGPYCLFSMLLNRCSNSKRLWLSFYNYYLPKQFLDNRHIFKKIIAVSEFIKRCLIQHGLKQEDIEVLPCFTNLPELKQDENENTVLFLGRIYKMKGLDYLIRAAQYIKAPFKLLVAGEGREIDNCKRLCHKVGLADKVRFVDWEFESSKYYREASVVVVPSLSPEPFGIVGIEAMSYAKPVVAFNVGGIPDWLEDKQTGFLVTPYNIKEMASKIELLLQDKTLATRLGQQGRQVVEAKFNKDIHLNRLLKIYAEVSEC